MKKVAKVEYGIQIVKPWSNEMYAHNEEVADVVREKVALKFAAELAKLRKDELEWEDAPEALKAIQTAIRPDKKGSNSEVRFTNLIIAIQTILIINK